MWKAIQLCWLVSDSLHKIAFTVDTSTELYNMKGKRVLKKSYLNYFSHRCVVHWPRYKLRMQRSNKLPASTPHGSAHATPCLRVTSTITIQNNRLTRYTNLAGVLTLELRGSIRRLKRTFLVAIKKSYRLKMKRFLTYSALLVLLLFLTSPSFVLDAFAQTVRQYQNLKPYLTSSLKTKLWAFLASFLGLTMLAE